MLRVDAKTLKSLKHLIWNEVAKQGWRFGVYFVSIAFAGLVTLAPPKLYGYFAEHVGSMQTLNDVSANEFLHKILSFGALIAISLFVSNCLRAITEEWISLRIEGSLRCRFMNFMHRMPLENFDESQRGDWLTRMSTDIRAVEQFIALRLPNQISDAVIAIAIACVFLSQNVTVALFLIVSSILLALGNLIIQNRLTPILDNLRDLHGEVLQGLLENFEGLRSIRSYRAESFVVKFFTARVHSIIEKGLGLIRKVGLLIGSNSFIVNMLSASTLCFVALKLRHQEILLSDVLLYPFYIGMFYISVFALVRGVFDWNDFVVHAKRLDAVFQSGASEVYVQNQPFEESFDRLEIKNAVIGYKGFSKLTKPFDFHVEIGETLIIRGHSGCGKSTFLESLAGLRHVEADHAKLYKEGSLVTAFSPTHERICVPVDLGVYVEQKPYLLEGSLKNNLQLQEHDMSEERLWSALQSVNLESFFKERNGLQFQIQDNGRNLSEGQKQRVGIARSLVHLRPLVLLDEPFASLDHESIDKLCTTLNALRKDHGLVIVTHIIPETLSYDRIVDFDSFCFPNASKEVSIDSVFQKDSSEKLLAEDSFLVLADCSV